MEREPDHPGNACMVDRCARTGSGVCLEGDDLNESEAEFLSWVVGLAKVRGWLVYHTWKSIHSPAGFPDLCMTRNPWNFKKKGRVIFAELKTEKGKPTPDQQEWLDNLYMAPGVEAYLWRPSMRPEIERILE